MEMDIKTEFGEINRYKVNMYLQIHKQFLVGLRTIRLCTHVYIEINLISTLLEKTLVIALLH
jgi:hypothetical protein